MSANIQGKATVNSPSDIGMRDYMAYTHLIAAMQFANLTLALEQDAVEGKPFTEKSVEFRSNLLDLHKAYVVSVIISSVAFLEAAINEVLRDAHESIDSYQKDLDDEQRAAVKELWRIERNIKTLDKYQLTLLLLKGIEATDRGGQDYENVSLLIKLRNEFVHHKPQTVWFSKQKNSEYRLQDKLKGKFEENFFFKGKNTHYMSRILGFSCAKWAIESSKIFVDKFFVSCDIVPSYEERLDRYVKWKEFKA